MVKPVLMMTAMVTSSIGEWDFVNMDNGPIDDNSGLIVPLLL